MILFPHHPFSICPFIFKFQGGGYETMRVDIIYVIHSFCQPVLFHVHQPWGGFGSLRCLFSKWMKWLMIIFHCGRKNYYGIKCSNNQTTDQPTDTQRPTNWMTNRKTDRMGHRKVSLPTKALHIYFDLEQRWVEMILLTTAAQNWTILMKK